jgi:predicted RNA binding protein YcfA (HicA-like mRNA interferase family)
MEEVAVAIIPSAWEKLNRWRETVMKVKDVIRRLEEEGWFLVATRGSHRQYKHPVRPGRVTVAGKPSDDLAPGTLNSILKQSGLKDQR